MSDSKRSPTNGRVRPARHATPPPAPPSRWPTALIAVAMTTWVLAYRPDPVVWAAIPGIVGWLALVERCRTWREVVLWTILFGAVATGIGYRWLAPTVQRFGDVDVVPSWIVVALFGIWNTIHGWIFAAIYRGVLKSGRRPHVLLTVAMFVGAEALPLRMFGWMSGHGAVDVPPLAQAAEWGGVVGVSFVLCCLIVPLHEWLRWAFVREGPPARPLSALVTFAIGAALFGFGLIRYQQVGAEAEAAEDHLRVAIVQPDVGSLDKRRAEAEGGTWRRRSLEAYQRVTQAALAEDPELIVWPETAITASVPMRDMQQTHYFLRREGWEFLLQAGATRAFLVGLYERIPTEPKLATGERPDVRYNAAGLRPPGGPQVEWQTVRKVYPIPFGEAMPFGIMEDRLPQSHRIRAASLPQPLLALERGTRTITFAPFICYEGILSEHVREYVDGKRPDVLISLTNDSWFGDSWEPMQHLNFTRFRAIEHRAPIVRATNTGISAFVASTGDVVATLGLGVADALVRDVPLVEREPTVYVRYGWRFRWLLWAVALLTWLVAIVRRVSDR